ncbi:sigma 54-interacting transcriptional regulator [Mucilaginibacter sp. ZT4R22]|uniref:Sigma 54-interacting transcriptional regulator n=1 Tax=Mucilaginibacter pankratovii TaxID=2772110 RepID=A0ABR7WRK2_9SPHI|nr:sigma 54-interacting transcriptional regulator [Mucilaginibacter pankratovii]MBD1364921.1 sigma 54-interacting transcriptional regulator [Mucilaginibacter pankratovii]
MSKKILIVEDEFIVANDLSMMLEKAGYDICDIADSVEEAREIIARQKPQLVLLDIHLKGKLTGIDLAKQLAEEQIAFVYLSANSNQKILEEAKATQPYGFMVKPFREKDVLVSLEIAQYLHEQNMLLKRNNEQMLQSALIDILGEETEWSQKFLKIAKTIQPYVPFDYLAVGMKNLDSLPYDGVSFLRTSFNDYQVIGFDELMNISGLKKADLLKLQEPSTDDTFSAVYNEDDFTDRCKYNVAKRFVARTFQMKSNLVMYVPVTGRPGFTFSFYSRKDDIYTSRHLALINKLQKPLSMAIDGLFVSHKNAKPTSPAIKPNAAPQQKLHKGFDGMIGSSHLLLTALDHLTLVAPMETSVLILGESGTGKERFAKSIHSRSARSKKQIIVVNCAALPTHLIESELFGHEKGAFTGAVEKRVGKFEQAAGGTIFLDEIGELPLEAQSKLLRVLQEKEIERLGGKETIRVDVRIIAATNCNLEKEVAAGKFRLDLYYRLNIFPIVLPALRERKEDIPELAEHFVAKYAERAGKAGMSISPQALNDLAHYHWPGNIRELEHLIERNVLLNRGNVIERISLPSAKPETDVAVSDAKVKTIDDNEREYILTVLKKCNGRISGPGGAAELLDVPSTTLNSKMKRLGITRKHVGG